MFKNKSKKMREVVVRQLCFLESSLAKVNKDEKSIHYNTLIAQKIILEDVLNLCRNKQLLILKLFLLMIALLMIQLI